MFGPTFHIWARREAAPRPLPPATSTENRRNGATTGFHIKTTHFRHLNFQKCSGREMFYLSLQNVLRATTTCNFWSLDLLSSSFLFSDSSQLFHLSILPEVWLLNFDHTVYHILPYTSVFIDIDTFTCTFPGCFEHGLEDAGATAVAGTASKRSWAFQGGRGIPSTRNKLFRLGKPWMMKRSFSVKIRKKGFSGQGLNTRR